MSTKQAEDVYSMTDYDEFPGAKQRSRPGQGPAEPSYEHVKDTNGRSVLDKPANRAILHGQRQRLEHQAKMAADAENKRAQTVARRRRSSSAASRPHVPRESGAGGLSYTTILIALLFFPLLSHFLTQTWTFGSEPYLRPYIRMIQESPYNPLGRTLITLTPAELARYDGSSDKRPVYVAVDGEVYDVSANRRVYGKGGSYNMMAGRDASRSFVTGCFETHLTHDTRGFGPQELKALQHWKLFFANHERYSHVGRVTNPPIDPASPIPEPCRPAGEGAPGADAARHGKKMPDPVKET